MAKAKPGQTDIEEYALLGWIFALKFESERVSIENIHPLKMNLP
jgi:hypothetical protein